MLALVALAHAHTHILTGTLTHTYRHSLSFAYGTNQHVSAQAQMCPNEDKHCPVRIRTHPRTPIFTHSLSLSLSLSLCPPNSHTSALAHTHTHCRKAPFLQHFNQIKDLDCILADHQYTRSQADDKKYYPDVNNG